MNREDMMNFLNEMDTELSGLYGKKKEPEKVVGDKEEAEYIYGLWGTKDGKQIYKYYNRETEKWVDKPPKGATYIDSHVAKLHKKEKLFKRNLVKWKESGEIPEWINTDEDLQNFYQAEWEKEKGIYGIEPQYFTETGEFIPESGRYGDVPNPYLEKRPNNEEVITEYSMGGKVQEHGNSAIDRLINGDE